MADVEVEAAINKMIAEVNRSKTVNNNGTPHGEFQLEGDGIFWRVVFVPAESYRVSSMSMKILKTTNVLLAEFMVLYMAAKVLGAILGGNSREQTDMASVKAQIDKKDRSLRYFSPANARWNG